MDQRIAQLIEFSIIEKSELKICADFVVPEDLPSFEGHFPGNPILPAVSIIDISLYLLSQLEPNISHSNIEVKKSKFMAMVRPKQALVLNAESSDGKQWVVNWLSKSDNSKLAQVQLVI